MQPYLFPYIGYYQLIAASDLFLLHGDVSLSRPSWVNRNRLLERSHGWRWFTAPIAAARRGTSINDTCIANGQPWRRRLLRFIQTNYGTSRYFATVFPLVSEIVLTPTDSIAELAAQSVRKISRAIPGSRGDIAWYSRDARADCPGDLGNLPRQTGHIIEICQQLGARTYINLPGGQRLYRRQDFLRHGIMLKFLQPPPLSVDTATGCCEHLSIIHTLMHHGFDRVADIIDSYSLQ